MTFVRKIRLAATVAMVAAGITLTACSSESDAEGQPTSDNLPAGEGVTEYPVTVETNFGEATIDQRPERIVTYGDITTELALSLGVTPVASDDWDQFSSFLIDHGAGDIETILEPVDNAIPTEAVAALEPDLIIFAGYQDGEKDFTELSKIAPVLGYIPSWQTDGTPWEEQLDDIAAVTDLPSAAEQVKQDHEDALAAIREQNPSFAEHTATFISDKGGSIFIEAFGGSPAEDFLTSLGFQKAPNAGNFTSSLEPVSQELIGELEADVIFVYDPTPGMPTLSENRTFNDFEASQNDLVFPLVWDREATTPEEKLPITMAVGLRSPSPLTEAWIAERIVEMLDGKL